MKHLVIFFIFGLIFAQVPTLGYAFGPFDSKPYLTPTSSPTNSICINWNTENQESTIVAYGVTTSLEDTVSIAGVCYYHHAMPTNLLPATEYFYRVVPWGDIKQFKTFPTQADSFTFIAFGDTRTDSAAHHSVVNRMAAYEFDFFVHDGDLVFPGDDTDAWRTFFDIEDTLLQNHHFLPAIGNHEAPFWPYDTLFALPDSEYYYSVNYGNAHCITLNTEMDLYGVQCDWLIDDLTTTDNNTAIDWIFVSLHRPPYSSRDSQMDVRDAWCPLFETYGVDIVFAGHDHNYQRTIPINGVVYIVTGGGGAPLHNVYPDIWTAYCEKTYHFCLIDIMSSKLFLKAIKPDGTVFDSLILDSITDEEISYNIQMLLSPNPFVHNLTIKYRINVPQNVQLRIYDIAGRYVKTIVKKSHDPGIYTVLWSGLDESGGTVDPGVYFLVLECGNQRVKRKIIKID